MSADLELVNRPMLLGISDNVERGCQVELHNTSLVIDTMESTDITKLSFELILQVYHLNISQLRYK